ncbi:saccharopine dehydrogenase [Micractinium conductrix]|uniref:Saccharopine dehydrogenase n=1 Tax=Micractinium conductrix TaxID=554055 RepID=A0A2P6VAE6_9CHLO|nr:saccharopine dehydrogenase [Micractinium conductrix]|eukprot:PSC71057.1 saccharopine dehydrogenase [Micractinium conductrix]
MSYALRAEFAGFRRFLTLRFFGAQSEPVAEATAAKYADHMRGLLGFVHRERGVPLDLLTFAHAFPSSAREGVAVVFAYMLWLQDTRKISVRTEGLVVRSAAAAAKFLYHNESKVNPGQGERAYSDLDIVREFRAMANSAKRQERVAPRVSDEELKWLSWPEYLQLCSELRRECAGRDSSGRRRTDGAVAWSLQRYLVFAIFSCVPDRQRTLRELEVGRTLVKDRDGRWIIRHGPGDYKTGRSYGERPPLVIADHIYPELEAWMGKWRACLEPTHNLLFTQQNGEPLTDKSLYKLFWTTSYRLTGKKCNPHLIRDSIVTYLRGSGASERELEALALYMGHSVDMQRSTYDRRSKEQKVEPAVELLAALNRRAINGGGGSSGSSDGEAADAHGYHKADMARAFDVVVWGATGFTGRLVAEHLARDYKTGVKWAIAGRSQERLEKLRSELSEQYGGELREVPILIGDIQNQASLDSIAAQTRVMLSTAGPFALYGTPVVDAAVRSGTHYVDITGEVPWVKTIVDKYHEAAAAKGVRIVPCCGFDSIPFDLGALLAVRHLAERYGKKTAKVLNVVMGSKGGVSGGTIASGLNMAKESKSNPEIAACARTVYALVPPESRGTDGEFWGVEKSAELGRWLAPFVMQVCNNRVVHRSNYFLHYTEDPKDFRYQEAIAAPSWFGARAVQLGTIAAGMAFSQTWLHPLLKKIVPAQGEGPSRDNMLNGYFKNRVLAWSAEPAGTAPTLVQAEVGDPHRDGGYWGTSRMLLESALCLALQQQELDKADDLQKGGVLTAASAMGMVLVERLRAAGMTYKILES